MTTDTSQCKRCHRPIELNAALSADVFEGMHWLCFHLEYEHSTDPDTACEDVSSCPWWTIRHYEERLRSLGLDPRDVLDDAIRQHFEGKTP